MSTEIQYDNLLEELRNRNAMAFKYLFEQYFRQMTLYAEYFLMEREAAEDIVQDIFSDLWHSADTLPEISNMKAYLFVLAKNRCLNRLKHLEIEDQYRQWMQEAQEYAEIPKDDLNTELINKVYATIEELPEQARIIFKRCTLDGKKYKEVADEMGLSIHTVNTQMKRSYKYLRSRLGVAYLIFVFFIG